MSENNNENGSLTAESASKPVEFILKKEPKKNDDSGITINLIGIFGKMKQRKNIFLRLLALCVVIGIAVPLLMFQTSLAPESAVAMLVFNSNYGETVSQLRSSSVLKDALESTGLESKLSVNQLSNQLTVQRVISNETLQKIALTKKLSSMSADDINSLLNSQLALSNRYVVVLNNNGALSKGESRRLLDGIVSSFGKYLYENLSEKNLPDNLLVGTKLSEKDYLDRLDSIGNALDSLILYCDETALLSPDFRSAKDGLSFEDLGALVRAFKKTKLDGAVASVLADALTVNADELMTELKFELNSLNAELSVLAKNIEAGAESIAGFKNKEVQVIGAETESKNNVIVTTSGAFNELVLSQVELLMQKSELESRISVLQSRIDVYKGKASKTSSSADSMTESIFNGAISLYDTVYEHAEEYFSNGKYGQTFFSSASVSTETAKLSSSLKKVIIGAVLGFIIGFIIWFIDGSVTEVRSSRKKANGGR